MWSFSRVLDTENMALLWLCLSYAPCKKWLCLLLSVAVGIRAPMPSPAVVLKKDLVALLEKLGARVAAAASVEDFAALPTGDEWGRVCDIARALLRAKKLKAESGPWLTWKELARLEKAYRPNLEFKPLYEPFVAAVERMASPYSRLQAGNWDKLSKDRVLVWSERSLISQTHDWLLNEVRLMSEFSQESQFLPYDKFISKHVANPMCSDGDVWKTAGNLVRPLLGGQSKIVAASANQGYLLFQVFQRSYLRWVNLARENGDKVNMAATQLRKLGDENFETRLVKLRHLQFGAPGYRKSHSSDGMHGRRGQVPTLAGLNAAKSTAVDTVRKRKASGAVPRKIASPSMKHALRKSREIIARGNLHVDHVKC